MDLPGFGGNSTFWNRQGGPCSLQIVAGVMFVTTWLAQDARGTHTEQTNTHKIRNVLLYTLHFISYK